MSQYAHVMCEDCYWPSHSVENDMLTNAHAGRMCCWCRTEVDYSLIVHRHPDAVSCNGNHDDEQIEDDVRRLL